MFKSAVFVICLGFLIINLAACGVDPFSGNNKSANSSGAVFGNKNSDTNTTPPPPGLQVPPAPSSEAQAAFQPALGLNTQKLFDQPVKDENDRFLRLEAAVQDIRDDFNEASPAITRLIAVEKDIQDLVGQLETLLDQEPAPQQPAPSFAPSVQSEPLGQETPLDIEEEAMADRAPMPLAKEPEVKMDKPFSPPSSTNQFDGLRIIRMADNAGKTRIVFESSNKMSPIMDLDNAEKILTVDFPKGKTGVDLSGVTKGSKLVKDISETRKDDGFVIVFALSQSSAILDQGYIPPGSSTPNHRFYIDLKR